MPAAVYIETHGGTGIGGSDDHAGVDIGRTFTETPPASTPEEFLRHVREGRAEARGEQGSAAKWAHSAMALATRALLEDARRAAPTRRARRPDAVLRIAERVDERGRRAQRRRSRGDLGPRGRPRAAARLARRGRPGAARPRRADRPDAGRRLQPRRALPPRAPASTSARCARPSIDGRRLRPTARRRTRGGGDRRGLFDACVPAIPYAPADGLPRAREGEARPAARASRAGWRWSPTRSAAMHGVTHTIEQIRERGVPGCEVEVIGTDRRVDRRLPRRRRGRGPLLRRARARRAEPPGARRDARRGPLRPRPPRLARPGRGRRGALIARIRSCRCSAATTPSSPPTRACAPATPSSRPGMRLALALFYGQCEPVLSPSPASRRLARRARRSSASGSPAGTAASTLARFDPASATAAPFPGEVKVLYAGRLTKEKGVDLLAEAFLRARERGPAPASAARRRRAGGGGAARAARRRTRPSSAGSTARSWRAPTRAPTCSSSAAAPTPTAR